MPETAPNTEVSQPIKIAVGFEWTSGGKTFVVTALKPGGVCDIQQKGRLIFGQAYQRNIRAALASPAR